MLPSRAMRPRHLLSVVIIMALFGSAYPIGKLGVDHFPPFQFAALRSVLLVVALLPLWRLRLPERRLIRPLAGFALCMGTGVYAAMYSALALAETVSPIVIGTQLSVPFAVILGGLFLGERVRLITWVAIVAAFGGIVIIGFEPGLMNDIPALLMIAVSALFYALATLFARALREMPVFVMNGWMAVSAVPLLGLLSLLLEQGHWSAVATADATDWAVLAHSALVISLLGHVWMFSLYRYYPVSNVIPYYVLMPVFGIALTLLIFAEVPSLQTLSGGALVIIATWAINRTTLMPAPPAATTTIASDSVLESESDAEPEQGAARDVAASYQQRN